MNKRLVVVSALIAFCVAALVGCGGGSKEPEPTYDLSFTDAKTECSNRDGWFGGRYAKFKVDASVKNDSKNPVNEDNMPVLKTSDDKQDFKPRLSQDKLLPGETCNITYEGELDVKEGDAPTLAFSGKFTFQGLDDATKELNEGLSNVVKEYDRKDAAKATEDNAKKTAEDAEKQAKEDAKKAVEASKGKTADEGLKAAKEAGYTAKFKDSTGKDVTSAVEDAKNGSDVHGAKISEVKETDGWPSATVEFTLEYTDPSAQKEREEKAAKDAAEAERQAQANVVVNAENNEEFAQVLGVKGPGDPLVAEFASKYAGRKIEFDGVVCSVMNHGSAKTRFDYLICVGDDPETATVGPNFKYEDVNFYDFKWEGASPDSVPVGTKLHCVAEVEKFNGTSELFFLKPVKTSLR